MNLSPDADTSYFGHRLSTLRRLEQLTQREMGERLGVKQAYLSRIEHADKPFPSALAVKASKEFALPFTFFQVPVGSIALGQATFRKKANAGARIEDRITALFEEAARVFAAVSEGSAYKAVALQNLQGEDAEQVAQTLREKAGLDSLAPIKNITRFIERLGFGVVSELDEKSLDAVQHSGMSMPTEANSRPLIATISADRGDVHRMTLGHELGHQIFDRRLASPIASTRSKEEQRAFRFSGALLVPARAILDGVTEELTLHGYLRLKATYGVSVAALVRRARDLNQISERRYRSLNIQLSSQGWRTIEPVDVPLETPLLFGQAMARVYGRRARSRASFDLGVAPKYLSRWVPRLAGDEEDSTQDNVVQFPVRGHRVKRTDALT